MGQSLSVFRTISRRAGMSSLQNEVEGRSCSAVINIKVSDVQPACGTITLKDGAKIKSYRVTKEGADAAERVINKKEKSRHKSVRLFMLLTAIGFCKKLT